MIPIYEVALEHRLSRRQTEVLKHIMQGLTAKVIGRTMRLTEGTVRQYLHTIYDKCNVASRAELIMIVMKHSNINTGGEPKMAPEEDRTQHETDEQRRERTNLSSVRMTDDESKAVQKTPNRVSLDAILAKIEHVDILHPPRHPHMTIAVLTLRNGFIIIGKSTPADPENFDAELGIKFAKEDAIRQIWVLEAYLLREKLTKEEW
jgi:DNA-binding CsgD family transcriptional regulator